MPHLMINGLKQEFETFGDIHNPPLIMLFGGATNTSTWRAWNYNDSITTLAKENYVIAYDRRGHGSSRCPAGTTLEDMAEDLFTLMDTLCIEKAGMVGMSAGTYLLGCVAGMAPERINSLILIVPHSHTAGGSPGTNFIRSMGNIDADTAMRLAYSPSTSETMINAYNEWNKQFADYPALPPEDAKAAFAAISDFDHRENFKKLKAPVLALSGQHDRVNPPEAGREIAELVDGGKFVEFSDCGHMLFNEKNDECVKCMMDFLRSTK